MATKIVTKNSSTASAAPTASDLVQGELAVNVTDKRLYTENASGAIVELGTNPSTIDINAGTIDGTVIGGTTTAAISGTTGQFGTSLNVDGTATMDGLTSSSTIKVDHTGDLTNAIQLGDHATIGSDTGIYFRTTGVAKLAVPSSGNILFSDTGTASLLNISGNGDISFYEDTGSTPKLFWDASAESLGIGTTSPQYITEIAKTQAGGIGPTLYLHNTADNAAVGHAAEIRFNLRGAEATTRNAAIQAVAESTYGTSPALTFLTSSGDSGSATERMRIDASGNIQQATSVNGDLTHKIYNANTGTAAQASLYITNSSANADGFFAGVNGSSATTASGFVQDAAYLGSGTGASGGLSIMTRANADMRFYTNGHTNERMRIDSSGNLLVGQTSASSNTVGTSLRQDGRNFYCADGNYSGHFNRKSSDGAIVHFAKNDAIIGSIGTVSNRLAIGSGDVGIFFDNLNDRWVPITQTGLADRDAAIDLGYSSSRFKNLYLSGRVVADGVTTSAHAWSSESNSTSSSAHLYFRNSNGFVGNIATSGTSTSYNTSSDYRLKENVVPMTGSIDRVKALKPSRFNFIADSDTTVDGFLAHEAQEVVPECATGTKDAMKDEEYEVTAAVEEVRDEDDNITTEAVEAVMGTRSVPDMQGIDQSKLVPLLVAALQEAIARIETLEAGV